MYKLIRSRESFPTLPKPIQPETRGGGIWGRTNQDAFRNVYASLNPLDSERNEVRIMSLAPGDGEDPLLCTLKTVSLLAEPVFEALSYCWSQDDRLETLPISPCYLNDEVIYALPNLSDALHNLRDKKIPRDLWVDYFCINQSDTNERNAQVQLMSSIYAQAWRVLCYIGEAEPDTDLAVDHFLTVSTDQNHFRDQFTGDNSEAIDRKGAAILRFMQKPWFRRIWTAQEVVLSKSALLICGDQVLPWNSIRAANTYWASHWECCAYFIQSHQGLSDAWAALNRAATRCFDQRPERLNYTLCDLMQLFVFYHASDPRDHIYGLLGMLGPEQRLIKVDYSLSRNTVFRNTAIEMMNQETEIKYLASMFFSKPPADHRAPLPSWVADFANLEPNFYFTRASRLFKACGHRDKAVFRNFDENTITYEGLIADTVAIVDTEEPATKIQNGVIMSQMDGKHLFDHLSNLEQMVSRNYAALARYNQGLELPQNTESKISATTPAAETEVLGNSSLAPIYVSLYRTLAFGVIDGHLFSCRRLDDSDVPTYQAARRDLAGFAASTVDTSPLDFFQSLDASRVFPYALCFTGVVCSMSFFITENGYLGVGPKGVQVGDKIAIFKGGLIPFIIRKRPETGEKISCADTYELLGGTYIEGGMDGELTPSEGLDDIQQTGTQSVWHEIYIS